MYHLQIFCLSDYTFHTVLRNKFILAVKLAWGWTGPEGFRKKTAYLLIGSSLIFPSSARKAVVSSSSSLSFKIPSSSPARGPTRQAGSRSQRGKLRMRGLDNPCLFSLQQLALQLGCSSGLSMFVFYLCRKGKVSTWVLLWKLAQIYLLLFLFRLLLVAVVIFYFRLGSIPASLEARSSIHHWDF